MTKEMISLEKEKLKLATEEQKSANAMLENELDMSKEFDYASKL
jgi:hypothetical protein